MAALLLASSITTGCSATQKVSGWFGSDENPTASTAWAGTRGAILHAAPDRDAKRVGRLAASEEVSRTKQENGYAYVTARGGALKGWVAVSSLTAKRPSRRPAAASTSPEGPASAVPPESSAETDPPAGPESEAGDDAADETTGGTVADEVDATVDAEVEATPSPAAPQPAPAADAPRQGTKASIFDPY